MTRTRTEHWWGLVGDASGTLNFPSRVKLIACPGWKVRRLTISWEEQTKCEGCGKPAKHEDIEGTPLCPRCWNELVKEAEQERKSR